MGGGRRTDKHQKYRGKKAQEKVKWEKTKKNPT